MRTHYGKTGEIPTVYETCENSKIDLGELGRLFPNGYHRDAAKIAGLRDK